MCKTLFYGDTQSVVAFMRNLLEILMGFTEQLSSLDKTKYVFDLSIWECNGHFDHFFQMLRFFCVAIEFV